MGKKLLKKLLFSIIACAAVFAAANLPGLRKAVYANDKTGNEKKLESGFEYAIRDGYAVITDYEGTATDVVIPEKIEGYSVTRIGVAAFSFCSGLRSISIPNSVRVIGSNAFMYCSGLTSISIPSSVTEIGWGVFSHCSGLTSIKVDSKNTVYTSGINANAIIEKKTGTLIAGCMNTVIPSSVKKIEEAAFDGCSGLKSISISRGVTKIEAYAFSDCSGLTSIKVDSKNTVYTSGNNANAVIEKKTGKLIAGCRNTVIPSSVTEIGEAAFQSCSELTSISIPSSVSWIGWAPFSGCDKLTAYVDSITRVKEVQSMIANDKVKVLCRQPISATASKTSLLVGEKATISVKGNKSPVKYVSSNPAVATVDANGNITALAAGKTTITINAIAKGYYAAAKKTIVIDVNNMKKINKVWYYVRNGKVDLSYTGMAKNKYGWWYITNGKLNTKYTGMAKNQYGWWYIKNGKVDLTYTGMAKNKYGWWYMTKGKLNTKFTGIATNKYGKWKFVNGKLVGKA